jgi:protoheme IX farnesyltransferase
VKPGVLTADPEPLSSGVKPDHSHAIDAPGFFADFCELVKARLTSLVLVTSLAGFYMGWSGPMDYGLLMNALFGTALVAAGAAALNQLVEREWDSAMRRTRDRPLPAGRMQPDAALLIGFVLSVGGLVYLALLVNQISAMLAALTLAIYVFVYTPLKRRTNLNTLVGAIPGALPPMIGWAAARGEIGLEAWVLFAILFFWQMPHFLAIAWMYREDYARAGFVMLPNTDESGESTGRQAVTYSFGLLLVSLLPTLVRMTTPAYFFGALALGVGMIACAVRMQLQPDRPRARTLFFASIIYLPLLLALLACGKVS